MQVTDAMQTALVCNVFIVAAVAALAGMLLGEDGAERVIAFFGVGMWLVGLSITGWFIYIVLHFVGKYW